MNRVLIKKSRSSTTESHDEWIVRIEQQEDSLVVSPLLGPGTLCEQCWTCRRAATLDPIKLAEEGNSSRELISSFNALHGNVEISIDDAKSAIVAKILEDRTREAERSSGPAVPPQLTLITMSQPAVQETVLPLPGCSHCHLPELGSKKSINHLIGSAAGIIVELMQVPAQDGEPDYPYVVVARLANTKLDPRWRMWSGASGKGATLDNAYASAVGEAIERHAARTPDDQLLLARFDEVENAISPNLLISSEGTPPVRPAFITKGEMAWVRGTSMADPCRTSWLPASSVYLALPDQYQDVAISSTTNGLACARTLNQATTLAYRELIERHFFFAVWYGLRPPSKLSADPFLNRITAIQFFEERGLTLRALILAIHRGLFVASASCWPRTNSLDRPSFALGLGCAANPTKALEKAVLEVGQVYRGLTWAIRNEALRHRAAELQAKPWLVEDSYDHALLYSVRPAETVASPFGTGPTRLLTQVEHELRDDPFFVDLTPRDVKSASGLRIARVVSAGVLPLHFGSKTLLSISKRIGLPSAPITDWIHPLC